MIMSHSNNIGITDSSFLSYVFSSPERTFPVLHSAPAEAASEGAAGAPSVAAWGTLCRLKGAGVGPARLCRPMAAL